MTSLAARRAVATASTAVLVAAGLVAAPVVTPAVAAAEPEEWYAVAHTDGGDDPFLTADGQHVFFVSGAADAVAGDTNGVADVFLSTAIAGSSDPYSGGATIVSLPDGSTGAALADGPSSDPVASLDARYVAFTSTAGNLVAGGTTPGRSHVYVRDILLHRTYLVQAGAEPDGDSYDPDLSDDGRYLVFTSAATNLSADDADASPDAFLADLDANGDGVRGDIAVTRIVPGKTVPGGTSHPVISGNGETIAFTAYASSLDGTPLAEADPRIWVGERANAGADPYVLSVGGHDVAIDATGRVFAYAHDSACGGQPAVVAATVYFESPVTVALGRYSVSTWYGGNSGVEISADGSTVAWTTTQPRYDPAAPPTSASAPIVRVERPHWEESRSGITCLEPAFYQFDSRDLAPGSSPSLSASGRTIAFASSADGDIRTVDTHASGALSVTSVDAVLGLPGFMTDVPIDRIPISSLRDYASALADAPVYRLPVYRLPIYRLPVYRLPIYRLPIYRLLTEDSPIYRLPIYRLPVYRLPIYRLDIPGGWAELLAPTPYGGELLQSVTLAEVLTWARDTLLPDSAAADAERAAAERIQSLTAHDVDLSGTGIDSLGLASVVLGDAPLTGIPIPGTGSNLARWQSIVDAQGIPLTVTAPAADVPGTVLAELDSAGVDISRTGIESVALRDLPIADTAMDAIPVDALYLEDTPLGALGVSTLSAPAQTALFGQIGVAGSLASPTSPILSSATLADLAAGVSPDVTFGALLFSLIDADSYPWEQVQPTSIDPELSDGESPGDPCGDGGRCKTAVEYRFTFDPGPGEATLLPAPTASVQLPTGTTLQYTANGASVFAAGSGPDASWVHADTVYRGPIQQDGGLVRYPLPDMRGGTMMAIETWHGPTNQPGDSVTSATLTSGALTASMTIQTDAVTEQFDDPTNNMTNGVPDRLLQTLQEGRIYYEWIAPASITYDGDHDVRIPGPAADEDFYLVRPPNQGERLIVSTNAADGQIAMELYAPTAGGETLGVASAGDAPGTPVTEQNGSASAAAEAGADAGATVTGRTLIDQAVADGAGTAELEAASIDVAPGGWLLLRVTSGNGNPSSALYSLRVRYVEESAETVCSPWTAPVGTGVVGQSDAITDATNTVYLVDTQRYGDTYGAAAADDVRAALETLTGKGHVGGTTVQGAVLSVDADPAVRAARAALDGNPCSMLARRTLAAAINAYVGAQLDGHRDQISSVVVVGGDDIIPLAPVGQHTAQFNEASHAADLRLTAPLAGGSCPATVDVGELDPCATPLSAAAAGDFILTDDPYALADAYSSLGGHLYVPTVGIGRLVETPQEIIATIARFTDPAVDGVLPADSTITGGYGAWSELPDAVTSALDWRSAANTRLALPWDAGDVTDALFPGTGESPRVVSINTHADERRMLPGIPGAESGVFGQEDLLTPDGHDGAASLAGALVFLIGCHAGNNLPSAYYGADATDWVDVFADAGGYVGNTGYGLANDVTTALSERLLALYADWIGVQVDGSTATTAQSLMYAKQSYLGGLGLYSGYDEKALMQTVFYGLPMYTVADTGATKTAPVPTIPASLSAVQTTDDGLTAASLTLTPSFATQSRTVDGRQVTYVTADGQEPLAVAGQPVLPRVVSRLDDAPVGSTPRGVLITSLSSEQSGTVTPAVAQPSIGVAEGAAQRAGAAFPSSFATVTRQLTPDGPADLLVVTPGRVELGQGGQGTVETFTSMGVDVVYGPEDSGDTAAPVLSALHVPTADEPYFGFSADGTGSAVVAAKVLVQPEDGPAAWQVLTESHAGGATSWSLDYTPTGPFRWIVQAVDAAGNVVTDTARGHLDVAEAPAPTLHDDGPSAVEQTLGDRLLRTVEVTDVDAGARLDGTMRLTDATGRVVQTGVVPVSTQPDGSVRAVLDHVVTLPGTFRATVRVCRGTACAETSFDLAVGGLNTAPAATVEISSDGPVDPTSTLTAIGTATDPDGDPVTIQYRWTQNGALATWGPTVDLAALGAQPGDVFAVTATPNDGRTDGHVASASVVVGAEVVPPPPPTITAIATNADGAYAEGTWSRSPVTVAFVCTRGGELSPDCPAPVVVSQDTPPDTAPIVRAIADGDQTASVSIRVLVDATAPSLAPAVAPNPVVRGAAATATAHAADAASGVATQSCAQPDTATTGDHTVTCTATDVAGNTATATARYTVVPATCRGDADRTAFSPINADGSSVFLRLSAVPILFRACDATGKPIGTKGFVTGVTQISAVPLPSSARVTELPYLLPTVKPVYVQLAGTWAGALGSLSLAGGKKYTYRVSLADGTSFTFTFGVR